MYQLNKKDLEIVHKASQGDFEKYRALERYALVRDKSGDTFLAAHISPNKSQSVYIFARADLKFFDTLVLNPKKMPTSPFPITGNDVNKFVPIRTLSIQEYMKEYELVDTLDEPLNYPNTTKFQHVDNLMMGHKTTRYNEVTRQSTEVDESIEVVHHKGLYALLIGSSYNVPWAIVDTNKYPKLYDDIRAAVKLVPQVLLAYRLTNRSIGVSQQYVGTYAIKITIRSGNIPVKKGHTALRYFFFDDKERVHISIEWPTK